MAYTTINKHTDYFNTKLYTGNGSTQSITGVGFQPDLNWVKYRGESHSHRLVDAVRGVTKYIVSNDTAVEATSANSLTAFGADGFSVGTDNEYNKNNNTYASWNWKAGTTSGITQGSATITPSSYSFNATSGFSIIKFTTPGSSTGTVPHGLGVAPKVIIGRITGSSSWQCGFDALQSGAWTSILTMNDNSAELTSNAAYGNTAPTSTLFTMNSANWGASGDAIAYCFAEVAGYSKFGSYIGNGNADGTFIYTGFRPSWLLVKRAVGGTQDWQLFDNKINPYNDATICLRPNEDAVQQTGNSMDLLSNGFKNRLTGSSVNTSGDTYIYMAFGQTMVGTNNVPATAR